MSITGSTNNWPAAASMPVQCTITGPASYAVGMTLSGVAGTASGVGSTLSAATQMAVASLWSLSAATAPGNGGVPVMGYASLVRWALAAFNVAQQDYANQGGT